MLIIGLSVSDWISLCRINQYYVIGACVCILIKYGVKQEISPIWEFYKVVEDLKFAIYLKCKKEVPRGGDNSCILLVTLLIT